MKTALLLVDIQNDYFSGGRMELVDTLSAAEGAARLLSAARQAGLPVYHIQHISTRPTATFFLPGSAGSEIHPLVTPRPGEPVIIKHYPNSFRETGLLERLRGDGVEQLIVCGMMTSMCVDATVRAAFDLGFGCRVAQDACATPDLALHGETVPAHQVQTAFLAALGAVYATIATVDDLITDITSGKI